MPCPGNDDHIDDDGDDDDDDTGDDNDDDDDDLWFMIHDSKNDFLVEGKTRVSRESSVEGLLNSGEVYIIRTLLSSCI